MRAPLLAALLVAATLAGCARGPPAQPPLVAYPHLGDVAVYEATGALVDLSRWENGHPFSVPSAQVRFTISSGTKVLDAARQVHDTYKVTTEVGEAGGFVKHGELYVSPKLDGIVESWYPLGQEGAVLAFDERGFPWLWGASALFGEELHSGDKVPVAMPDNLGTGLHADLVWVISQDGDQLRADLTGGPNATLWLKPGSPWPTRVSMTLASELAPNVRLDGPASATIDARLVALSAGNDAIAPRDRDAVFIEDAQAQKLNWDGEKPPDGDTSQLQYPLSQAVADAKLLDQGLQGWMKGASDPRLYRGSYQVEAGPVQGSTSALWLLQFVDKTESYYEVQISRITAPQLPSGIPRVEKSGPAQAPKNEAQGWFAASEVPKAIVPLGEGIRIMQQVFGAPQVQVFLRSFATPPGYSYFIDGGWDVGKRYTVVYNPNTALLEEATGPVTPREAK